MKGLAGEVTGKGAITLEQVTKVFPRMERPAVDHVEMAVQAGELVVVLGGSGCGKTTLLKLVNRLHEPTSGRVLIDGEDARTLPVTALRRGIGYVIQQVGLFPHMTVAENIAIVPKLLGWGQAETRERVLALLEMVGLSAGFRQRKPRQLSGGEQSRVGLARALAGDPAILLMDEPFAAVDAITRRRLQGSLLKIQRQLHKTILFVTHDVEEALLLADRLAILRNGRLVQYDTPLAVLHRPADAYVRDLVGSDSVLRRFSLVKVAAILPAILPTQAVRQPSSEEVGSTIGVQDDLRTAVARLLECRSGVLTVLNDHGDAIGSLAFADLQAFMQEEDLVTQKEAAA